MTETWRPIPGVEAYAASSLGRIRRQVGGKGTREGKVLTPVWVGRYAYVHVGQVLGLLHPHGRGGKPENRRVPVARLVCAAFHGPPPSPDHITRFKDGDTTNVKAANLRWELQQRFDRAAYMRRLRERKKGQAE